MNVYLWDYLSSIHWRFVSKDLVINFGIKRYIPGKTSLFRSFLVFVKLVHFIGLIHLLFAFDWFFKQIPIVFQPQSSSPKKLSWFSVISLVQSCNSSRLKFWKRWLLKLIALKARRRTSSHCCRQYFPPLSARGAGIFRHQPFGRQKFLPVSAAIMSPKCAVKYVHLPLVP